MNRLNRFFVFLLVASIFCLISNDIQAQDRGFKKENLFFGGDLGLNFNNNGAYVLIAPVMGYRFLESRSLSLAIGPSFEYFKSGTLSTNSFGGRTFARYDILRNLFLHAEYEGLSIKQSGISDRVWIDRLPLGGGYRQSLGGRANLNFMVLYDVLYDSGSPYNNNSFDGFIVRGGVTMGL